MVLFRDDVDDDVSGHYIRGSRSPPGIANHLLRSAVTHTSAGIKVGIIDRNNIIEYPYMIVSLS